MTQRDREWTSRLWPRELEAAVRLAARAHHRQFRKRSGGEEECAEDHAALGEECIPYMTHLTGTAVILARSGAGPDLIAAGLLHDLLEDVPEIAGEELIERVAGRRVLELVRAVTEDKDRARPAAASWQERKAQQLAHLATAEEDVVWIKAADALHNLLSLIADLEDARDPEIVWARFNAPPELELAYFSQLSEVVSRRLGRRLPAVELAAAVRRLRSLTPTRDGVG